MDINSGVGNFLNFNSAAKTLSRMDSVPVYVPAIALSMSLIHGQNGCTGWRCQLNWCLQKQHAPLEWKWLKKCSLVWIAFPLAANCTFLADARSECENARYIARIAQIKKNPLQPMGQPRYSAARATATYQQ